ncbi:tyrosine-type recombinase/integrase [Flavobacterium sp.]|uniref:tyrosine-type recombinase/integrase n=1 Tax=Flavobacterium sp. TaxID=239 RepID=UPI00374DC8B2
MQNSQKTLSHVRSTIFIDYRPAELCIKTQWLVVYYAKNPVSQKMERFRVNIPAIKSKTERVKQGKRIVFEVNKKLDSGWLPYYENTDANNFKTLEFCCNKFLEHTAKDVANGTKRADTNKSYKSGISMLNKYVADNKLNTKLILEINRAFVVNYLDWIVYKRKVSATTHNNHIVFLGVFFSFCVERGFMAQNFATGIKKKKKEEKKRKYLPQIEKEKIKLLQVENHEFYTLCMMTYFCFVRNTELTKIRVSNINLNENYITISGKDSKNKKTATITIPDNYKPTLQKHLENAKPTDFVFSTDNFKTGKKPVGTKKIYDTWIKFKTKNKIATEYQFYSLKDTGITDLMNLGTPTIKVRDQARHYDIKITETYMYRNDSCDEIVRNSNFSF